MLFRHGTVLAVVFADISTRALAEMSEHGTRALEGGCIPKVGHNTPGGSHINPDECNGCNLIKANECINYMKQHPPIDCDFLSLSADSQPSCCSAYEGAATCLKDLECEDTDLMENLWHECRHHKCIFGCEISAGGSIHRSYSLFSLPFVACAELQDWWTENNYPINDPSSPAPFSVSTKPTMIPWYWQQWSSSMAWCQLATIVLALVIMRQQLDHTYSFATSLLSA